MDKVSVSASKLHTMETCARRAKWSSVLGLRLGPGSSALLGRRCHKRVENFLNDGSPLGEDREGLILLPTRSHWVKRRKEGFAAERSFKFTYSDFVFRGVVDASAIRGDTVFIDDLKTTSSVDNYALSESGLAVDPQRIIYAFEACKHAKVEKVVCTWVYAQTWSPKAQPKPQCSIVVVEVPYKDVVEQFVDLCMGPAERYKQILGISMGELEHVYEACIKYPPHGCPWVPWCEPNPIRVEAARERDRDKYRRKK